MVSFSGNDIEDIVDDDDESSINDVLAGAVSFESICSGFEMAVVDVVVVVAVAVGEIIPVDPTLTGDSVVSFKELY